MIDDLVHHSHSEKKQQLSSFLPLILVTSIIVGGVTGLIGGVVGSRYLEENEGGAAFESSFPDETAPEIIAFFHPPVVPQPTLQDVIDVLTAQQQAALQARLESRKP